MNSLDAFSAFLVILIAIALVIIFQHQFARRRHNAPSSAHGSESGNRSHHFCARRHPIRGAQPRAKLRPENLPALRAAHKFSDTRQGR